MFTHPALLRELVLTADVLRRNGEAEWARRVVQASDDLRRTGWTDSGLKVLRGLSEGERGLNQVSFGAEHLRAAGGPEAISKANERLERHRRKIEDLASLPVRAQQAGPRPRSPDLEP
jgi:hypothetical protein